MLIKKEKILQTNNGFHICRLSLIFLMTAPQSLRNAIEVTENGSPKDGHGKDAQLPKNFEIYQGGKRD